MEAEEATQEALIAKSEAEGLRMEAEEHAEALETLDQTENRLFPKDLPRIVHAINPYFESSGRGSERPRR